MIRKMLDKMHPLFAKGGKFEKLYPLYEAQDTFLYTPGEVTDKNTHVRDSIDLKRMMSMVIVALVPCIFMALFNTGFQANRVIATAVQADESYQPVGWRYDVLDSIGVDYKNEAYVESSSFYGSLFNPVRLFHCLIHGALFFFPIYIVTMAVGGTAELIFSIIRGHEINEGFLVTGMLFPLTLPPNMPLWQVGIGIVFGVVVGKEIFGGTGMNFLNPALTARAFLYFAYAPRISGANVWTAVDGYSGATALGKWAEPQTDGKWTEGGQLSMPGEVRPIGEDGKPGEIVANVDNSLSWLDSFFGNVHGSMGETSTFACLLGAAILIAAGIGSWRIMAGLAIGTTVLSGLLYVIGSAVDSSNELMTMLPWWHMVIGGFAFGTVFMATDPVSASMTEAGKWVYGILIGLVTVMVRVINPAFPEGIMLAILFGNVFAPLIDYFVIQANVKRRLARYEA